jgi:hypothetical protein
VQLAPALLSTTSGQRLSMRGVALPDIVARSRACPVVERGRPKDMALALTN